jgi:hypothetical protein
MTGLASGFIADQLLDANQVARATCDDLSVAHGDQPISSVAAVGPRSIIYIGMDVHKESVTLALLPVDA